MPLLCLLKEQRRLTTKLSQLLTTESKFEVVSHLRTAEEDLQHPLEEVWGSEKQVLESWQQPLVEELKSLAKEVDK